MIGVIMALAGLINFTNMMITNIITRRHEFATMQSIGMTNRQLRQMMIYEGLYYAGAADTIGAIFADVVLHAAVHFGSGIDYRGGVSAVGRNHPGHCAALLQQGDSGGTAENIEIDT